MRKVNFGQKLLDSRWKLSDQLIQLKGLVEFDERYRYWIGLKDEIKIEEREKEIKKLAEKVKQLRGLVQKYNASEIGIIDTVIQQDREVFLKCRGKEPQDIIEDLNQMVLRKKLAVDKSFYEVKKKEKDLYDIQGQITLAKEKMSQEEQIVRNKDIEEREKYSAALEYAKTQKDVCRITLDSYNKLLGILKNDSRYFDDLLSMLKEDALVQSNSIMKMMTLGQMLSEDFSWLKTEAKKHAITFNADTKDTRLSIRKINNDMKQLEKMNTKLREYAAFSYPLFQEELNEPTLPEEEIELRTVLTDLEEFTDKWKNSLNAEGEMDFFPKLFKVFRINGDLHKRIINLKTQKDFQEETCTKLELVNAELDNYLDDYVRKDLAEIMNMENEMNVISEEMHTLKNEEDKINQDMDFYRNTMYQLKRLLRYVHIGPPFGDGIDAEFDLGAVKKLRQENTVFHLDSESEEEETDNKHGNMEEIARSYLDPNVTLDMKSAFKYETEIIKEENIIQLFDNVMMQMKTLYEALSPEVMSQDPTEEELLSLGDFYCDMQNESDSVIEGCLEKEKVVYKHFKPKYDDFHKKNCSNKTRLEIKIENQIMVFENEGPTVGVILSKGATHPPGVIRGMYVPETDSEEDEENEDGKKQEKEEAKGSDEDDMDYLNDEATVSSGDGGLDSDLDPDQPKPHICF